MMANTLYVFLIIVSCIWTMERMQSVGQVMKVKTVTVITLKVGNVNQHLQYCFPIQFVQTINCTIALKKLCGCYDICVTYCLFFTNLQSVTSVVVIEFLCYQGSCHCLVMV